MSEVAEKKKRSPVERLIVWGLIGVLLVVVFIEFQASRNFNAAYQVLSDLNPSNRPTLDELKDQISGESVSEKQTDDMGTAEVEMSFFSLFKADKYKLRIQLADVPKDGDPELIAKLSEGGGTVVDFYQPETLAEERNRKIEPPVPSDDPSSDDALANATGGPGVGGGGGAPDHGDGNDDGDSRIIAGDDGTSAAGGGPGAGGGRRGRGGPRGMAGIAMNSEVQSKLNITNEQATKLSAVAESNQFDWASMRDMEPAERTTAISEYRTTIANGIKEVLNAEQFETIQRMTWAQEGPMALAHEEVATRIGLTEDQVAELAKIREGMDRRNPPVDEMLAVLNDEQKAKWSELIEGMEPPAPPTPQGGGRPSRPAIEE